MKRWRFLLLFLLIIGFGVGCLLVGGVKIPAHAIWGSLMGGEVEKETWRAIVLETRLPMTITASTAGMALAIAGMMLQTCFDNPLAGPSILGISTGASLGVAVVMLAMGGSIGTGWSMYASTLTGAVMGSALVMGILLGFSRILRSGVMFLIAGVLIGYFASSAISLLNFFSTQEGVHSYVIWGLGSFSGSSLSRSWIFALICIPVAIGSVVLIKPLNAMLLGARYAESLGYRTTTVRTWLLAVSGTLTAAATAFCGPIAFVGLVVPHVARMMMGTADHRIILPATALCGCATGLLCAFLSVLPGEGGVIPVNAITPVLGVPVIIYVILKRRR